MVAVLYSFYFLQFWKSNMESRMIPLGNAAVLYLKIPWALLKENQEYFYYFWKKYNDALYHRQIKVQYFFFEGSDGLLYFE